MVRVKLPVQVIGMQVIGQIAVMALLTSPSFAGPQFVDGAALSGYDAVAYQDEGAAVRGETTITTEWNGATWRFATPAHLAQFHADPARYAPAYDGHCAYAASEGRKSGGMPELWQVKGGRLYLLCSKSAVEKWTSEFDTGAVAGCPSQSAAIGHAQPGTTGHAVTEKI
jgi:YHS domain-containing protein